jgi:hypothetical protein
MYFLQVQTVALPTRKIRRQNGYDSTVEEAVEVVITTGVPVTPVGAHYVEYIYIWSTIVPGTCTPSTPVLGRN